MEQSLSAGIEDIVVDPITSKVYVLQKRPEEGRYQTWPYDYYSGMIQMEEPASSTSPTIKTCLMENGTHVQEYMNTAVEQLSLIMM